MYQKFIGLWNAIFNHIFYRAVVSQPQPLHGKRWRVQITYVLFRGRFAYVARIGPCQRHAARRRGYGRTSSDNGWFLWGSPAPCRARRFEDKPPYRARFSAPALGTTARRTTVAIASRRLRRWIVVTQTSARRRMPLGSSADVKDQPASPQPSPHPDREGKIHVRGVSPLLTVGE